MASLPSVVLGNTIKLESEFKKHTFSPTLPFEKRNDSIAIRLRDGVDPMLWDFKEALAVIKEGTDLKPTVYIPLLQECIQKNSILEARSVHGHIIKTGMVRDVYIMTFVINAYGKCGAMEYAQKLFDKLSYRNVVTWTCLMSGYIFNGQPELGIHVFIKMLEFGGYPTNHTLGIALNACSSCGAFELGKQIHSFIIKYQNEHDTSVGNALCSLYSKSGSLSSSITAMRRTKEKNVISWTTAMSACIEHGETLKGLNLFIELLSEGVEINEYSLTTALTLCHTIWAVDVGVQIHSLSTKLGYSSNIPVINSIMYLYLKCGLLNEAMKLFDGMNKSSLLTWNALIAGHARLMTTADDIVSSHYYGIEALNIYSKLNRSEMKPDIYTFSSLLTVCSSLVAMEQGEQIHAQAVKKGFLSDVVVRTALVSMYSRCGSIEKASRAFVEIPKRTMISWTSMISAFAQHGRSQQALQVFEDMRLAGVRPNKITFLALLSACSHAGLVDEAFSYFEMMKNEYNIQPFIDHYLSFIDMFVRLGKLEEAFDFIKKENFKPNQCIWSLLVEGCRRHGNLELGFYAAEQLLDLDPRNPKNYTMLINMYAKAGRSDDASRVRKMMEDANVGKLKDWSWISIRNKIFSFRPDDHLSSPNEDIDILLRDLVEKTRNLGYEPQCSVELTEEMDKESNSGTAVHHGEKLAVAFGLLNLPKSAPIRVIKSILMCNDCHSFLKIVSKLTAREIIVRDSKRLHRFVDGQCSCGDIGSLF